MNDPVVEEIHKYREQYAAKFNFDITAICEDIRRRQVESGIEVVSRPAKKIFEDQTALTDTNP